MKARHVTSDLEFRSPFGAVQLGGAVTLSINVWDEEVVFCNLRVWTDAHGEELLEMRGVDMGGYLRFSVEYRPRETGVVWYSFDIEAKDGSVWRYGAKGNGWTTGEGAFAYGDPPSFQITVYRPRKKQPTWYREGIVYQIFPDRFARGEDWHERAATSLAIKRKGGPAREIVEDWDAPVTYRRTEDGGIASWGFYGGTLEGIRENLEYLEDLGVTVLYLNPIFEAASNHRYDTADYLRIDPMLGDEQSFRELCVDAAERGISVILDGVFNHCGADSRYFNRFGTYKEPGAWQGDASPYRDWFTFNDDGTYAGWWGDQNLPSIRSGCEDFHELVCGRSGVIRTWLRSGARGWRLDVADELTDEFIEEIKRALLVEKPDGVLIGEVWEDASNKEAYGKLRHYFQGKELDGTMNYPVRTALLGYLRNEIPAGEVAARLQQLRENYPPDNFYSALNLLGSHDRERLFTMLGGAPWPDGMSDEECRDYRLSPEQAGLATARLWVIALLQMTLPGVPCIYYGDERGLEGFRDPYNRGTFPWDGGRADCATVYRNAIAVRKTLPVLVDGDFEPFAYGDDVLGFWRRGESSSVCVLVNASLSEAHTVRVPLRGEVCSDVISGQVPKVSGGQAEVFLWPLGTTVLLFHDRVTLQQPMERGMGVLCHITSIPNEASQMLALNIYDTFYARSGAQWNAARARRGGDAQVPREDRHLQGLPRVLCGERLLAHAVRHLPRPQGPARRRSVADVARALPQLREPPRDQSARGRRHREPEAPAVRLQLRVERPSRLCARARNPDHRRHAHVRLRGLRRRLERAGHLRPGRDRPHPQDGRRSGRRVRARGAGLGQPHLSLGRPARAELRLVAPQVQPRARPL